MAPNVVQDANVRVSQRSDCSALHAQCAVGRSGYLASLVRWKKLDRDGAIQTSVARLVDLAHATRLQ